MSSEIEINSLGTETIVNESISFNKEGTDLPVINIINEQFVNKIAENNEENNFDSDNDDCSNKVKRNKNKMIHDSESEEDINSIIDATQSENLITPVETLSKKRHKRLAIVDSDSEEEAETVTTHNKSFSDDIQSNSEQPVFITNSEGQLIPENISLDKKISQATRLSALCDSESSEDEVDKEKEYEENNRSEESDVIAAVQYKKKRKPKEKDVKKPKKMTGKQAAELRTEIKSESQRMLREKNVSLPYHKPKSFTLKEFLSKRPKFSSALPVGVKVPPSVAIKMSAEQLTLVSKKLKEREKEVKQFYKSESESEDDHDDKDYVPPCESKAENNQEMSKELSEATNISVTLSDENKDEGNCPELTSTEITPVISDPVDHEAIDEGELNPIVNNVSDISFKDCDTDKGTEISDILNSVTVEQGPNEKIRIISNINLSVNYNLTNEDSVHKTLETCDKYEEDIESNTNLTVNNEDSIHNNPQSVEDKEDNTFSETLGTNERKEKYSMEYEFNLDGLEENTENILGKEHSNRFEYTDLDREIENFGSDNNELSPAPTEQSKNLSKLELIKESIANITPKLIGGPDDVIDLDTGVAKPNEVTKLMKRFLEHNLKKAVHKSNVELSIISFESGEIHEETVAMKLEDESEVIAKEEKPGAKLQKLRDELQNQMAQKRSELWQKKITKQPNNEEENIYEGEKEHCEENDDILDDEEEEMEMTESSEEEDDDEEERETDDVNEKKKSVFIDEEAEESDEEEGVIIEATSDDDVANEGDDENEIGDLSDCDEDEDEEINQTSHTVNESETPSTNKTFRKILKGFTEDSDEEESENVKKPEDTNIVSQEDDDVIPPHQPQSSQTPIRKITQKKSDFEFLTPISYITGLQNLQNSTSKSLKDSPVTLFQNLNEPSPLKENNWQKNLQKKLFTGSEITDSQVEQLYSEQFPETQEVKDSVSPNLDQITNSCSEEFPCTTNSMENEEQLVELCSGKFPSTAELVENRLSDPPPQTQDLLNICSGEFTGITQNESAGNPENNTKTSYLFNRNTEVKSLDEDQDLIISQLIDEEEMEKFKKRFESPLISNTQRRIVEEFEEAVASGGVIDSDDDTDTVEVKKKNKKRIMFTDDEDSEGEDNEEEVIDLHDNIEDDDSNVAPDDIAYDSEENEIELVDDGGGPNLKPSDFFENEAELSESEWGSADEDEKDLDTMEFEQGDAENYDEKKIRSDLEKIHMRQLLDDDTRQVKLLQEMLLEDGELHGTGRERQFKWKNIDSVGDEDEKKGEEDDFYLEEDESEEQWRKRRHEREMFLKEKLKKSQELDDDSLLSDSQLLKIGHKVLQRSQSNSQNNTPIDKSSEISESPVLKQSFTLLNKRGSFLSRSDQVLQRLAEYSKVTSATLGTATAKNSRNFLFQTVTVKETSVVDKQNKKRKAADGTPNVIKRLRLSNNLSPAVKKKPNAKTKLFGNW